jgi:hypothetical protein
MNYNTSFLELARGDITPSPVSTVKSCETAFKLTQLIGYVKEPVKLLICFKDNYKTYFALEKIKDCSIAPAIKQVQTKTVYENNVTLAKFLQVNFVEAIQKIRYVESRVATLCAVEVTSENLILPAEKELFWLDSGEVTDNLAWQDREPFQALLLKV